MTQTSRVTLAAVLRAAADAHDFVALVLHHWQLDTLRDAATLVVSELVTNALRASADAGPAAPEIIETSLQLLEDPQALYKRCDDQQRRRLNQALFEALYIHEEPDGELRITHQLMEPFDSLHTAQAAHHRPTAAPTAPASYQAHANSARPSRGQALRWNLQGPP